MSYLCRTLPSCVVPCAVLMSYLALYCYPMEDFMACHREYYVVPYDKMSSAAYAYPLHPEIGRSSRKIWEYILRYLVPGAGIFRKIDSFKISFSTPPPRMVLKMQYCLWLMGSLCVVGYLEKVCKHLMADIFGQEGVVCCNIITFLSPQTKYKDVPQP